MNSLDVLRIDWAYMLREIYVISTTVAAALLLYVEFELPALSSVIVMGGLMALYTALEDYTNDTN